jgi:hypothetical protein
MFLLPNRSHLLDKMSLIIALCPLSTHPPKIRDSCVGSLLSSTLLTEFRGESDCLIVVPTPLESRCILADHADEIFKMKDQAHMIATVDLHMVSSTVLLPSPAVMMTISFFLLS